MMTTALPHGAYAPSLLSAAETLISLKTGSCCKARSMTCACNSTFMCAPCMARLQSMRSRKVYTFRPRKFVYYWYWLQEIEWCRLSLRVRLPAFT